jgi:hypothetical protein
MKQKTRIIIGIFHYCTGAALFSSPLMGSEYHAIGVLDSAIGVILLMAPLFARFEIGLMKLLSYREYLFTILVFSLILGLFSLAHLKESPVQLGCLLIAILSAISSVYALKVHPLKRRLILG